jgi:hypothetical protein
VFNVESIWKERNATSFKNCEILVADIKNVMLESPYTWIAAYNSLHFSSVFLFFYLFFIVLFLGLVFFFFSLIGHLSCISMYYDCALLRFLMRLNYLSYIYIYIYIYWNHQFWIHL